MGEQRGQKGDKDHHFQLVWKLFFQILHRTQQVSVTILERARRTVVAGVTVDDEDSSQGLIAQNIARDLSGTRLPEAKQADLLAAKEPGVAIATVGAPAGLIGMFDGSQTIIQQQLLAGRLQEFCHLMQRSVKCAVAHSELNLQLAQSNAKDVMLNGEVRQQRVAQEIAFDHAGRAWSNGCGGTAHSTFPASGNGNAVAGEVGHRARYGGRTLYIAANRRSPDRHPESAGRSPGPLALACRPYVRSPCGRGALRRQRPWIVQFADTQMVVGIFGLVTSMAAMVCPNSEAE